MRAALSIMGLYQYDNTIFDGLTLPAGMDAEIAIKTICVQLSDLEVLYASAPAMKAAIALWAARRAYSWGKLYATTSLDYNPIDNYDRTEERSSGRTGTVGFAGSDEARRFVPGFNSTDAPEVERTTSTPGVTTTAEDEATESVHAHGNIGVTTTQQMIQAERGVAAFDLYQVICDEFKREFCIMVY